MEMGGGSGWLAMDSLDASQEEINETLDFLVARGWLVSGMFDGHRVRLEPTDKGRALLPRLREIAFDLDADPRRLNLITALVTSADPEQFGARDGRGERD